MMEPILLVDQFVPQSSPTILGKLRRKSIALGSLVSHRHPQSSPPSIANASRSGSQIQTPATYSHIMVMVKQEAGNRSSSDPSTAEWEAQKATIINLWKTKKMSELIRIMNQQHSFRANKRQYQRKFKNWGVSKNMSITKKMEWTRNLLENGAFGNTVGSSTSASFNMNARERAKLLRFLKDQGRNILSASTKQDEPLLSRVRHTSVEALEEKEISLRVGRDASLQDTLLTMPQGYSEQGESMRAARFHGFGQPPVRNITPYTSSFQPQHSRPESVQSPFEDGEDGEHEEGLDDETQSVADYVFGPFPPPLLARKDTMIDTKKLLQSIDKYFASGTIPLGYEDQLTTYTTSGPDPPPSHEFWANLKRGIYLVKVQSYPLGVPALNKACTLAPVLLASPASFDFHFLRELFLTLSPVTTRSSPDVRTLLLKHLTQFARLKLGAQHPISIICYELQFDNDDREVSEKALICMLNSIRKYCQQSIDITDMEVRLECSIITLLRRDNDLGAAATQAKALLRKTQQRLPALWNFNQTAETIRAMKRARMAATELAHIYMDMSSDQYEEALSLCFFVLTGYPKVVDAHATTPSSLPLIIHDSKSFHTMEDLAKIYNEVGNVRQAMHWLKQATILGKAIFDPDHAAGMTALAFVAEKMQRLRSGRGGKTADGEKRYDI